jgi:hypothetical protein
MGISRICCQPLNSPQRVPQAFINHAIMAIAYVDKTAVPPTTSPTPSAQTATSPLPCAPAVHPTGPACTPSTGPASGRRLPPARSSPG